MPGIHSVRLILPGDILPNGFVTFRDGRIDQIGDGAHPDATTDGHGRFLAPGFLDLHVHGGNGADFLDATPDAFCRAAQFHLEGGTTSLCPTLATATYEKFGAALDAFRTATSRAPSRLLPLHLEGPHLAHAKAGAQDPQLLITPEEKHIRWLEQHAEYISQVTVAPEISNALRFIERASDAGIRVSVGHSDATADQAAAGVALGATKVTHLFNAMSTSAKHGLFREAGLAEYALTDDRLTCEVIADGFHVPPVMIRMAFRAKGTQRMVLVSDALAGAGLPPGSEFRLGRLACVVDHGYCKLADGSALSGSATRLIDHVRFVTRKAGISLVDAVHMATKTPARVLGLAGDLGEIAPGCQADLVEFDEDVNVQRVWVGGRPVVGQAAD